MDVQKNPWKKGSLRPLSSKQKEDQHSKENTGANNKDMNGGGLFGMEITGTKITKQSEAQLMKFTMNRTNKSQRSNGKNDDSKSEVEEEKWNSDKKRQSSQQQAMDETVYSEVSNIYIDDELDDFEKNKNNKGKLDFGNFMQEKIENNPDKKRVYDNYLLEQKRREHEEELKKQTSKPFQFQKGRMSSSASNYSKQRSNITTNDGLEGLQHYERSTEYGSKPETKSEIGDDFMATSDFLGSRMERISVMGNIPDGQNQRVNNKVQNKPFKISELKRNSSRTEQQTQPDLPKNSQSEKPSATVTKKKNLSVKEKKRIQDEEAILKKNSQNQQNQIWKVNDPHARQVEQLERAYKERKEEQIQNAVKSLDQIGKKMTKQNKLKVIALVNGNRNMEEMSENKPMTEYDIELAEKEAQVYDMERKERFQQMQDFVEDDISQMSAQELKNRGLFITNFDKNRSSLKQSFYSEMSQLQQENEFHPDQLNEFTEFDQMSHQSEERKEMDDMEEENSIQGDFKRKNGNIIQRNIDNAFKSEFQQADEGIENFLPEEVKQRLLNLMSGCEDFNLKREEENILQGGNPFGLNEEESQVLKDLQEQLEKIKMDDNTIQQILGHELFSLKDAILPKDPNLRDETEIKILKEKMNSVNERLRDLFDVEKKKETKSKIGNKVEKIKIQNLISQLIEQNGTAEPSVEIENLLEDFEENQRMLDESRRIISDLQGQDIEREVGEYNQILLEAIEIQRKYEEMLDLNTQNALMEEQTDIIKDFKKQFDEIQNIQSEIEEKEKKFVKVIKENNLADLLGIQFNEDNDDYEVEDIKQIEQQEEEKLQREIQAEIDRINKRYDQFEETQIDQKLQDMQDYDDMITQKLAELNPTLLDDIRQSILVQQEEEELKRSMAFRDRPSYLNYDQNEDNEISEKDEYKDNNGDEEEEEISQSVNVDEDAKEENYAIKLKLENNFNEEQIQETIDILEKRQREKEQRERQRKEYFDNMKQVREREQAIEVEENQIQNQSEVQGEVHFKMLQDSLMVDNYSETNTNNMNDNTTNTEEKQNQFEDSLEM